MKHKLLFTSIILMLLSLGVYAQSEKEPYVVVDKDGTATFYYNSSKPEGALPIQSQFSDPNWSDTRNSVTKVVFDDSFKDYKPTSCAYWFWNFDNLTEISGMKENLNTANVTTMYAMFHGCSSLTTLDVSNFNTANVTNMREMFYDCSSLTTLDVSNFNTANVTNMSKMFCYCSSLTTLDVSNFNTANVTTMYAMFHGCSSLTTLDVSNFNTANVTNMSHMFHGCSSLTTLDLSNFNTANVTNMGSMFDWCSSLTTLDVSNFNTANVTDMSVMFYKCNSLTTLDVSNFNTANVTDMTSMFGSCSSLNAIFVGDNWSTASVTNSSGMFYDCTKLYGGKGTAYNADITDATYAKIDGGKDAPGYFTKSGDPAFDPHKPYAIVKDGVVTFYSGISVPDGALPMLTEMDDNNWTSSIRSSITKVVFDKTFKEYKPVKLSYWFNSMENLTEISGMENLNTENVEYMSAMFQFSKNLTSINLSGFNTAKVTDMTRLFYGCENLESIFVGDNWSTASVTKSSGMFDDCTKLYGGKGTAYNADITDATYAKIDGGKDAPGYFTKSGEPAFTTPVSDISGKEIGIKVWSFNNTIYIENAPDTKYTIIDLNGRMIKSATTKSTKEEISTLKSGVYIVVIGNDSYKVSLR